MADDMSSDLIEQIANEVLQALSERRQIAPFSSRFPDFDLKLAAQVNARVAEMRRVLGEIPVGRKLGFTNRNIWDEYKVYAPIWSYVYDRTVRDISSTCAADFDLGSVVEPRIEPEITLGLSRPPEPGMDERALLECIDFVAHGFEVVQSLFPGWVFAAPDTVAAFGLHGALFLGPRHAINGANRRAWMSRLSQFEVTLFRDGEPVDKGHARNVLDGPLSALKDAVAVLAADKHNPPIAAGEIVTTGTLTRAFPMIRGQHWRTQFVRAPFESLVLTLI